jgi:hypothetical protein
MRQWLTDDIKSYNDNKKLYKDILRVPFEEKYLWYAKKEKEVALTTEHTGIPVTSVGEVLNTRNLTPDEEFSILYSASLIYYLANLKYEHRDLPAEFFENSIFPIHEKEILDKAVKTSVEITKIHRYDYKIVMPKNLNAYDVDNLVINMTFLYEDLLKTPIVNPKTSKTFTGIETLNYFDFSEEFTKNAIRDMLQCELFNYVLACELDNQTANNMWNTYNWDVVVNTIYKMYVEEAKALTEKA